jgi:hypothetical protein
LKRIKKVMKKQAKKLLSTAGAGNATEVDDAAFGK